MNRGIDKEAIENPKIKGKITKANPIRVDGLITLEMDNAIAGISEALKIEKAAAVRMLLWFGLRFAVHRKLPQIADEQGFKYGSQSVHRIDTRISQDMLDAIEELMRIHKLSKSGIVKTLLYWALENIGNYTIADLLKSSPRK